jgi:6,7-dimethyl-8-ribityllumazine synthase
MGEVYRYEPAHGVRVAIVVSRFNERLTAQLLDGALAVLAQHGGDADVFWVPGAFELPQAAAGVSVLDYAGVLTLGCLIKGDTDHYAVLAAEVTRRLGELSVGLDIPLCFGVLTCQTLEQAELRADPAREDKGGEVMHALLEMVALREHLDLLEADALLELLDEQEAADD